MAAGGVGDAIGVAAVVAPEAEAEFLGLLGDLLSAAQRAGTARPEVSVPEVKAVIVGCQAAQAYNPDVAEQVTEIVINGLRATPR